MSEHALTREPRSSAVAVFGRNWAIFFLLVMIVVFFFTGRNFLTISNVQTILYSATTSLLLAFAETFVIIARGIDLSVGYVMGFSTIVCAGVIRDLYAAQFGVHWPAGVAIALGIVAGLVASLACGLASGVLVSRFRVPPFIATLGVLGVAYGLTLHAKRRGLPDRLPSKRPHGDRQRLRLLLQPRPSCLQLLRASSSGPRDPRSRR